MKPNDSAKKSYSLTKLLGVVILFSVCFVGMQFQKQRRQSLLFSSSAFENPQLLYAMETAALLFGSNITNIGSSQPADNTILVSNLFTQAAAEQNNNTKKKQRSIFFIHVGKTGGTTLRETVLRYGCRLYGSDQARANCQRFLKKHGGESTLGKRTRGIFHYQQKHPKTKRQINKMDWMFVVREPIARFMSSFEYINPHNCILGKKERNMEQKCNRQFQAKNFPGSFPSKFFYDCFTNIQEFIQFQPPSMDIGKKKKAKRKAKTNVDPQIQKCHQLWKGAFAPGLFNDYGHMTANYQYYTKGLKLLSSQTTSDVETPTRKVYVIRTEHLWEDVSTIDSMVGGTGNFSHVKGKIVNRQTTNTQGINKKEITESTVRMNATTTATTTTSLSDTSQSAKQSIKLVPLPFCCALLPDMLTFRNIVNRADNLNEAQKQETNAMAWTRCNATSWGDLQSKCGKSTKQKKKKEMK